MPEPDARKEGAGLRGLLQGGNRKVVVGLLLLPLVFCCLPFGALGLLDSHWESQLQDELEALEDEGLGTSDEELHAELPAENGADDLAKAGSPFEGLPLSVSIMVGSRPRAVRAALTDPDDLEGQLVFMHEPGEPGSPKDAVGAAKMVVAIVDRYEAHVDAGLGKPCVFPVDWSQGFEADLDHLMAVKELTGGLMVRAGWSVFNGRSDEAWADLERVLGLAGTLDEATLISRLVRHAVVGQARTMIEDLLQLGPPPGEDRRRRIAKALEGFDETEGLTLAMRGEINLALHTLPEDPADFLKAAGGGGAKGAPPGGDLMAKLFYGRWRRDYVRTMARVVRITELPGQEALAEGRVFEANEVQDLSLLAKLLLPAVVKATKKELRTQASVRLARAGLRLAASRPLPKRTPAWLPVDPLDPDEGRLRYRHLGPGKAIVWSVGDDEADDGGKGEDPVEGHVEGEGLDDVFRIDLPR